MNCFRSNLQRYRAYWPLIINKVMCPRLPYIGWRPLGRRWWKFFLWWPSNRSCWVEDQLLSQRSRYLVSSCWLWYMGPIDSIWGSWWTWSCSWRNGEHPMLHFNGLPLWVITFAIIHDWNHVSIVWSKAPSCGGIPKIMGLWWVWPCILVPNPQLYLHKRWRISWT